VFPLAESGGLGAFGFRRFHTACIITRRVHQKQALFASAKIEDDTPRDGRGLKRRSGTGVLATYLNLFRNGWPHIVSLGCKCRGVTLVARDCKKVGHAGCPFNRSESAKGVLNRRTHAGTQAGGASLCGRCRQDARSHKFCAPFALTPSREGYSIMALSFHGWRWHGRRVLGRDSEHHRPACRAVCPGADYLVRQRRPRRSLAPTAMRTS